MAKTDNYKDPKQGTRKRTDKARAKWEGHFSSMDDKRNGVVPIPPLKKPSKNISRGK